MKNGKWKMTNGKSVVFPNSARREETNQEPEQTTPIGV